MSSPDPGIPRGAAASAPNGAAGEVLLAGGLFGDGDAMPCRILAGLRGAPPPPRGLTGAARRVRLAAIGSRVPHGGPLQTTGLGLARPSQEGRRIAAPFLFSALAGTYTHHQAPRCRRTPSPAASARRRPRTAREAWPCRVRKLPSFSARAAGIRTRRIPGAVRGTAVRISEVPWEVLRHRAKLRPRPAQAQQGALPPHAAGEAGRLSLCAGPLKTRVSGEGTAQSAWRPAGAGSARPGERDSRCRASSPLRAGTPRLRINMERVACARSSAGQERRITNPEGGGSNPPGRTADRHCGGVA